ncbi:hypothetical protein VM1G_11547 [Cytospora mali]|uniref:Uncharacterized protein n=1 Tax=Cytospora mali TaxID=578113 RepID=A0A194VYQ2_CYTMA|nr:hypothetical protein VM1G_11547 [Valsa mali]
MARWMSRLNDVWLAQQLREPRTEDATTHAAQCVQTLFNMALWKEEKRQQHTRICRDSRVPGLLRSGIRWPHLQTLGLQYELS